MGREYVEKIITAGPLNVAADSDAVVWPLFVSNRRIKVVKVLLGATAAMTAADTNYNTVAIKHGTTTIYSFANGPAASGESLAAGVIEEKALATPVEVPADTPIKITFTKTGTGLAITGFYVGLVYYDYDA